MASYKPQGKAHGWQKASADQSQMTLVSAALLLVSSVKSGIFPSSLTYSFLHRILKGLPKARPSSPLLYYTVLF